jgi:hypothetical protein
MLVRVEKAFISRGAAAVALESWRDRSKGIQQTPHRTFFEQAQVVGQQTLATI